MSYEQFIGANQRLRFGRAETLSNEHLQNVGGRQVILIDYK